MGRRKKKRATNNDDTSQSDPPSDRAVDVLSRAQMETESKERRPVEDQSDPPSDRAVDVLSRAQMETESKKRVPVEVRPNINIYQRISAQSIQIGSENTMNISQSSLSPEEELESKGACAPPLSSYSQFVSPGRMSYAEVCAINRKEPKISIECKVTTTEDEKEHKSQDEPKHRDIRTFLESVNDFKTGHFVLLIGKNDQVNNLDSLAYVPWIMVMDFDPDSRSSGTLSSVQKPLEKNRSFQSKSIQENTTIAEQSTNWLFMTGSRDRPETLISDEFIKWRREIKACYQTHLQQLDKFGQAYTKYTLIIIWPQDSTKARHFQYVIDEFDDLLSPTMILLDDGHRKEAIEESVLASVLEDHSDLQKFSLSLKDLCNIVSSQFSVEKERTSHNYQLPGQNDSGISEEKARWLSDDLEVLYLETFTTQEFTAEDLKREEENFFKGGTLPWAWWYRVGTGHLDVERDIMNPLLNFIRNTHVRLAKPGIVTLYHAPGSGGTTLAQRCLWEMRKEIPCAQVKHRSWVSVLELSERIGFLCDKTRNPILILIDGEEEQRVDAIERALMSHCVIILYVKRHPIRIEEKKFNSGKFWLQSNISKQEAAVLGLKYEKQCTEQKKAAAVWRLVIDVEKGAYHTFFEFGLTVHNHEYKGLESYVKGYLQLDKTQERRLLNWQKALAYLSLVYYYGQTSLPCFFLSKVLHSNRILSVNELPIEMKEFVVRDVRDGKSNVVRISHYLVAKEILDQLLPRTIVVNRPVSQFICNEAKQMLSEFATEFIKLSGAINKDSSSTTICKTMTKTFIVRDNKAVGEDETQATKQKRAKVSQILEDAGNRPPYTERFTILQQLATSFPKEAQFRAHMGRMYTLCRPEEEMKAEKCFKEALEMCLKEVEGMRVEDMPHTKKLDLRNIYHMYGNMLISRIAKYTGRCLGEIPERRTDELHFSSTGISLLKSVKNACSLFENCREVTPSGYEESFGYIGEIQVRLMFCDFVNSQSGSKDLHEYVQNNATEIAEFVQECYVALDELFLECFSVIEPEKMDKSIENCQEWFAAIFKATPRGRQRQFRDDIPSRRMEIAKVKMQYSTKKTSGVLELINRKGDICFIVSGYEQNFGEYETFDSQRKTADSEKRPSTKVIDMDYREWLFAIRHRLFPDDYQIDVVLKRVQSWYDQFHTPYSRFYLFILQSLLGIGLYGQSGNTSLLLNAQHLKDEVLKHSKHMAKPKYPREWLGTETTSIRRLAPGRRFFKNIEGKDFLGDEQDKLEIRKGTISPPNNRPAWGFIDLDLGPSNKVPVKVFFVPARAEMKGVSYQGTRVQFVIGFSLSHGYEAFNVKPLKEIICESCKRTIEARSCDAEVTCNVCLSENTVEHRQMTTLLHKSNENE